MSLQFAGARELRDIDSRPNKKAGSCTTNARCPRKVDRRSAALPQVSNTSTNLPPPGTDLARVMPPPRRRLGAARSALV